MRLINRSVDIKKCTSHKVRGFILTLFTETAFFLRSGTGLAV
jgi:hypothetical protein